MARKAHYADHLAPVWKALPAERRGRFYVPPAIAGHLEDLEIPPTAYTGHAPEWRPGGPVVLAATGDYRRAVRARRPIVFMSHGCGQAFDTAEGRPSRSYAGGRGRVATALFLATNAYQAGRWRRTYPHHPCEVIGCPKLDDHPVEAMSHGVPAGPVCMSFHWPCQIAPEAGTAWSHYRDALPALAERFDLIAHAHPRATEIRTEIEAMGIPFLDSFDEVLRTASVYVNDCSSTLYEFAAVRGPVVVMNAPWFRRSATHGGRFWDWADVGPQVAGPEDLPAAIELALTDPPELAARRRQVVGEVYPHRPSAPRAAAAILRLMEA